MRGNQKFFQILLCFILIAGTPYGSMAADKSPSPPLIKGITSENNPPPEPTPVPVTPPGKNGLLSGMTPGNYSVPSGWSLFRAQDFEGTKPSDETWELWGASLQTDRKHGGTYSLGGTYNNSQDDIAWRLWGLGSFKEVYVSFYEYVESQALFNDEFFLARWFNDVQEVVVDWFWAYNGNESLSFNGTKAGLYTVSQGTISQGAVSDRWMHYRGLVPIGSWVQWELHYRPNTPRNSDGFMRIYKDGYLFGTMGVENVNLNGTVEMNNADMQIGGVYSKGTWMTDFPTCSPPNGCSSQPGEGNDLCTNQVGTPKWLGNSFADPVCNPIDPPLPSFKRYFDDIIIMKR